MFKSILLSLIKNFISNFINAGVRLDRSLAHLFFFHLHVEKGA